MIFMNRVMGLIATNLIFMETLLYCVSYNLTTILTIS